MGVETIREIFRKVASGERKHGSFLTLFAQALMHADSVNEMAMQSCAEYFIKKYNLQSYAPLVAKADCECYIASDRPASEHMLNCPIYQSAK